MAKPEDVAVLDIDGRSVRITHPGKLYFKREAQVSKLDLVRYYLAVAPGALNGIRDRPVVLKRFVNGADEEPFYQKRAPTDRPAWLESVVITFPSGRTAEEVVVNDPAGLAWIVNLGCMELHPHAVTTDDLEHPNELRVDLDPGPGVEFADVRRVALEVQALLGEHGLRGWPKTSGSRGIHVNCRIHPRWGFTDVRRAALALSREIERRVPTLATSKWWKEERHGVFLDYNQNAKDRTTCSAYSVRPLPDARVSAPLAWEEIADCNPADFNVFTMPARFAERGDPNATMDEHPGTLDSLLELAARNERNGEPDAPWPPHFRKMDKEAPRVQPSKAVVKKAVVFSAPAVGHEPDTAPETTKTASRKTATKKTPVKKTAAAKKATGTGRRQSTMPLIVVANSPDKAAALAGLERWKAKHAAAAGYLAVDDVLVDSMRGTSTNWFRIRLNLRHVPDDLRPVQATPDPDDDPTRAWKQ